MRPLTDRQKDVLDAVCTTIKTRGFPPTLRELALALGISKTGVVGHLNALATKGAIVREIATARGIRILTANNRQ